MRTSLPMTPVKQRAADRLLGAARMALSCLDLTDLNEQSTQTDVQGLCWRAMGAGGVMPAVAAVCVWPRLAAFAREQLPPSIAVAAVVNFPGGEQTLESVLREVQQVMQAGAQEVDCVLPYRRLLAADVAACTDLLQSVRAAATGRVLKVILETGELQQPEIIAQASRLALDCGADFLKTSTGKTPHGASLPAARSMLQAISKHSRARQLGFKPSGGLRTVADVLPYLDLVQEVLGPGALVAPRFRIGASSLWNDIAQVLGVGGAATQAAATSKPVY
ncbi:MAG: deoxyribose-phosphate aldolase [Comamonadaceae bacterium]